MKIISKSLFVCKLTASLVKSESGTILGEQGETEVRGRPLPLLAGRLYKQGDLHMKLVIAPASPADLHILRPES